MTAPIRTPLEVLPIVATFPITDPVGLPSEVAEVARICAAVELRRLAVPVQRESEPEPVAPICEAQNPNSTEAA